MPNGSAKPRSPKMKSKLKVKPHKSIKHKRKNKNPNLGTGTGTGTEEKEGKKEINTKEGGGANGGSGSALTLISAGPADRQLHFFLHCYQTATKSKLSPLELETYQERCMVELAEGVDQDVDNFSDHIKEAFGVLWKEELCEAKELGSYVEVGSPTLLVISISALRSLELLRGLKPFTKECRPAKLFAKHLKVEEQVNLLKAQVNIACGTPSRCTYWVTCLGYMLYAARIWIKLKKIKKLIDMEALSLKRLKLVVLDMQRDAKAFSLFTLPQVSAEFWDLYKTCLEEKVTKGNMRICFYGAVSNKGINKAFKE